MKVARFYAPGDVRLEEVDEPTPGAGEVKIRVRNCSTCGTNVKILRNGHPNMTPPRVMGHEMAGEVVQVGEDVSGWSSGDRVQVIAAIPDGSCEECRRGRLTVCTNQTSMGYQYEGGFAGYMIVPRAVLAYGPSWTSRRPSRPRTVVATHGPSNPSAPRSSPLSASAAM